MTSSTDNNTDIENVEKDIEISQEKFILNWKYKKVNKKLIYDLERCFGCDLCKLGCPVEAIDLGPISDIAQKKLNESTPKILIDHEKCCFCMLCVVVCPNDAFHENIEPAGQIDLNEFPSIGKFYEIDLEKCIEDINNELCNLCLKVRKRHNIKEYYKIEKECPAKCFYITSPIEGEVIIKKNMLHKCSPENCAACINICPTECFFIPESAEDVIKYGKIACNVEKCFYCGACENSCPDDLIKVNRKKIKINNPKKKGVYPWIQGWIKNFKEVLRKRLLQGKIQVEIPLIEEEQIIPSDEDYSLEKIPQLSAADRQVFHKLNDKVQSLLAKSQIRYWIKDRKFKKIRQKIKKEKKR